MSARISSLTCWGALGSFNSSARLVPSGLSKASLNTMKGYGALAMSLHRSPHAAVSSHDTQAAGGGERRKLDTGLLKHPRFNFAVPFVQQVQRPLFIVFFASARRLVALNLRHHAHRQFVHPVRQRGKAAAKSVQRDMR